MRRVAAINPTIRKGSGTSACSRKEICTVYRSSTSITTGRTRSRRSMTGAGIAAARSWRPSMSPPSTSRIRAPAASSIPSPT
jgi:hypothetical protein